MRPGDTHPELDAIKARSRARQRESARRHDALSPEEKAEKAGWVPIRPSHVELALDGEPALSPT